MNKRRILFTSALIVLLIVISVLCFITGRGHTVYFDNKTIEGTNYEAYTYIEVYYKGEMLTSLAKRERTESTLIGQKLKFSVKYQKKRNDMEEEADFVVDVPYDMDGVVINIPALIEGASSDQYLSAFVPLISYEETEEETPNTDEFAMPTED